VEFDSITDIYFDGHNLLLCS